MKTTHTPILLLALTCFALGGPLSRAAETPITVRADNRLGFALEKAVARGELSRRPNQNILLSPLSASVALQMLLNGAAKGSRTYQEMAATLGVEQLSLDAVNAANQQLLTGLQSAPIAHPTGEDTPFQLKIADSVWADADSSFRYRPVFLRSLSESYQAEAQLADFSQPAAVLDINHWASEATAGKIPTVIDAATLSKLQFVMLNATYFKASWRYPFEARHTVRGEDFRLGDGTTAKVDMMGGRRFGYTETAGTQVMELPYAGETAAMYVVLPKEGRGIIDAISDARGPLTESFWAEVAGADRGFAQFSMPKFSFSYSSKLNDTLRQLGMRTLFTAEADLSAMATVPAKVDLVKQDTFIRVDEKGTEAAAVTEIGGVTMALPPAPEAIMRVDRPFLISIVDKPTGAILFLGLVNRP